MFALRVQNRQSEHSRSRLSLPKECSPISNPDVRHLCKDPSKTANVKINRTSNVNILLLRTAV